MDFQRPKGTLETITYTFLSVVRGGAGPTHMLNSYTI
jgi:hypothetical protein